MEEESDRMSDEVDVFLEMMARAFKRDSQYNMLKNQERKIEWKPMGSQLTTYKLSKKD